MTFANVTHPGQGLNESSEKLQRRGTLVIKKEQPLDVEQLMRDFDLNS